MPILEAIVLGIIQGLTEFLPISSTAHLALTPWLVTKLGLANWSDPGLTFDVALHGGTLLAILVYFWRTWLQILSAAFGGKVVRFSETSDSQRNLTPEEERSERRLLWYMIAATIPAGLAGALLEKRIETSFRSPLLMASMLIIVAIVMWVAERASRFQKPLPQINFGDAMTVGVLRHSRSCLASRARASLSPADSFATSPAKLLRGSASCFPLPSSRARRCSNSTT